MSRSAISSRPAVRPAGAFGRRAGTAAALILAAWPAAAAPQVADCVAAYVNRRAITLTDIRILTAFELGEPPAADGALPAPRLVLQKAIDRQVVVDLIRGNIPIAPEEIAARLTALKSGLEPGEWQLRLETFGITEKGLESYLETILRYERMVNIRFGRPPEVTVQEIEEYYNREYAPSRRSSGLEPRPMAQAASEIEERLRDRKREAEISEWIRGLRAQTEIRIHDECLENLK